MNELQALAALLEEANDPHIEDLTGRVLGILKTTVELARGGIAEDLELLVITVQDFAGQRVNCHHEARVDFANNEFAELMKRVGAPSDQP